jgi:hypothetical protein
VPRMSAAGRSIFFFGIYLGLLSVILMVHPEPMLGVLRLPKADPFWTRMAGLVVGYLAYYYCHGGRHDARSFMRATIVARATVIAFFSAFVLLRLAGPTLILIGAVDAAGALWTWSALRSEHRQARGGAE